MIKVLVAEDHPIMRDVLRRLLEQAEDIEIVAMERSGEKAVNKAIVHHPDVVILDLMMPTMDGIEATKEILAQSPETRVLILSGFNTHEYIEKSLEVGALGYVLKDFMRVDLLSGVRSVYEGHRYFSPQIAEVANRYFAGGLSELPIQTPRDRENNHPRRPETAWVTCVTTLTKVVCLAMQMLERKPNEEPVLTVEEDAIEYELRRIDMRGYEQSVFISYAWMERAKKSPTVSSEL